MNATISERSKRILQVLAYYEGLSRVDIQEAHSYSPLSYRGYDEQAYKDALILFYEQGSLANFREL